MKGRRIKVRGAGGLFIGAGEGIRTLDPNLGKVVHGRVELAPAQMVTASECRYRWLRAPDLNLR
jgi:hypothetical protein